MMHPAKPRIFRLPDRITESREAPCPLEHHDFEKSEGRILEIPSINELTLDDKFKILADPELFKRYMPTIEEVKQLHSTSLFSTGEAAVHALRSDAQLQKTHFENFLAICELLGIEYHSENLESVASDDPCAPPPPSVFIFKFSETMDAKNKFFYKTEEVNQFQFEQTVLCKHITRMIDSLDLLQEKKIASHFASFVMKHATYAISKLPVRTEMTRQWISRQARLKSEVEEIIKRRDEMASAPYVLDTYLESGRDQDFVAARKEFIERKKESFLPRNFYSRIAAPTMPYGYVFNYDPSSLNSNYYRNIDSGTQPK